MEYSSSSIADIDGNGTKDLLIAGSDEGNTLTAKVYLGDSQGGFTEAGAGLTGLGGGSTSIGDFSNDGHPDLLITGFDEDGTPTTTLYLQNERAALSTRASE